MRAVATIFTTSKHTSGNLSTKVFSRSQSDMKQNESLEGVSVPPRSGVTRQSGPYGEKVTTGDKPRERTPEKQPAAWKAGKAAAGAHGGAAHPSPSHAGAVSHPGAAYVPPSQAAHASPSHAAHASPSHAAAAAATQAVQHAVDEFPAVRKKIQEFVPRLKPHLHKGECGRIAVFGGSFEYTGAPYFAAISALRMGADMVHVFCAKEAGPVIKSYSPDLIVHPCLDTGDGLKHIEPLLEKFHALVIGPGMGRSPAIFKHVSAIINFCKKILRPAPPLVLDADALYLITEDLNIIKHYPGPIFMTPNVVEFSKLATRASETNPVKLALYYNAVIIQKGVVDTISNGFHTNKSTFTDMGLSCAVGGGKRRCAGQGDVLAGCLGTFVAWLNNHMKTEVKFDFSRIEVEEAGQYKPGFLKDTLSFYSAAAYGACTIARTSSKLAFEARGRGMTTTDVVTFVDKAFKTHFEVST